MLFSLALKNILRSKGRSIITLLLSTLTTILFIIYVAFMDGSHHQFIKSSVEIYTGYAHIDLKGYRDDSGYENLIEDADLINKILEKDPSISHYAALSKLQDSLIKGEYLSDSDTNAIYLGSDLAKRLKVNVGNQIAMVGSSIDYSIAADLFTVKGIFKTGLFEFDSQSAFVNKSYLDTIMMSDNIASYFTLNFHDNDRIDRVTAALSGTSNVG
jgi:ABC-type lipoprotein release transport system permease subunit